MEHILALVAVENVAYHFDILYGYLVPKELTDRVKPGVRVLVSFGRGKQTLRQGIVFELSSVENGDGYKAISSVVDDEDALVNEEILSVARFLKDRTFCTYYEAVRAQIPSGFSFKTTVRYFARAVEESPMLTDAEAEVYSFMLGLPEPQTDTYIYKSLGISPDADIISRLVKKELVIKITDAHKNIGEANSLERVAKEENTGILKIYNIVANILHSVGNSYTNQVNEDSFCATIILNKKYLMYGSENSIS